MIVGILTLLVLGCVLAVGCISTNNHSLTCDISEYEEYHDVQIDATADTLEAAGFVLGDSVDLHFSNGKTFLDVPYLSGYIIPKGTVSLILYNNNLYIDKVYIGGLWNLLDLNSGDTITIVRREPRKYAAEQEVNSYIISTNQLENESDEEFSNFRPLNYGDLKENYIFRGASPIDNLEKRASVTDKLLEKYGIKTIFSLSGTDKIVEKQQLENNHNSPYFDNLYANGYVIMSGISSDVFSEENRKIICESLRSLMSYKGPYYFHCLEGKERTGFLAILINVLGNATEEEILQDYFKTYENYYHITPETKPEIYAKFKSSRLDPLLDGITKNGVLSLKDGAITYLKEGGLTEFEIRELITIITK